MAQNLSTQTLGNPERQNKLGKIPYLRARGFDLDAMAADLRSGQEGIDLLKRGAPVLVWINEDDLAKIANSTDMGIQ